MTTVSELIERIASAYPGATPEALKSFKPVYYARLRKHEGASLEAAASEVFGSFKAKYDQKFPIPIDFEQHLPSNHPKGTPSIKDALQAAAQERDRAYRAWQDGQGAKLKAELPAQVYGACSLMALELARKGGFRELNREQQRVAEERAVSSERVRRFGRLPPTREAWEDQCARIRGEWGLILPPVVDLAPDQWMEAPAANPLHGQNSGPSGDVKKSSQERGPVFDMDDQWDSLPEGDDYGA